MAKQTFFRREVVRFLFVSIALLVSSLFLSTQLHAQEVQIKGKVVAENDNAGLPGVAIYVKGGSGGTITDLNGRYQIDVPDENGILIFSFIGMETQEVPIEGRTEINVVLDESAQALDEVIIVGYGTQKKANLSGAVTQVKLSSINS
ncbi:MAG: carboxypeptidase-like regulatory domain-containing protein, partial [Cyclobacteriaceae bacterium]|nr:carboxypeptidase-like regulatory domain-containing protein [Cyclobacteriaceae bacterium]